MITCGKAGSIFEVSFVKHDLAKDIEVTKFSIYDTYVGLDHKTHRVYFQVTVWEELPLVTGNKVRILYMNDLTVFQMKSKNGTPQLFYSFSAKVEVVP